MNELSQKELELINGYIDQELADEEIIQFAELLIDKPLAKKMIRDLDQTKHQIQAVQLVNPPRNYTLAHSMAAEKRKPPIFERLFPAFRTAAIMCSLALVFTFVYPLMNQPVGLSENQMAAKSIPNVALLEDAEVAEAEIEDLPMTPANNAALSHPMSVQMASNSAAMAVPTQEAFVVNQPAFGIRGGSPKAEFLLKAEREVVENRSFDNKIDSMADATVTTTDQLASPADSVRSSLTKDQVVQLGLVFVLLFSLVWIMIAQHYRKQIKQAIDTF